MRSNVGDVGAKWILLGQTGWKFLGRLSALASGWEAEAIKAGEKGDARNVNQETDLILEQPRNESLVQPAELSSAERRAAGNGQINKHRIPKK